jgi:protein-tyrosine phosphatase
MTHTPRVSVLFVCLGNICRSPTAEAVFVREVRAAGLSHLVHVDSAGTGDWHAGELAHPPTRALASSRGVEITHRARQITRADLDAFDHLVVMDRENRRNVLALASHDAHRSKVRLFREFEQGAGADAEVPDPYYSGEFGLVFDICERASAGLLAHLRRTHAL